MRRRCGTGVSGGRVAAWQVDTRSGVRYAAASAFYSFLMLRFCTYLALIAVTATSVILGVTSLNSKSPTYDEYSYYGLGKEIAATGSWDRPGATFHPPLSYYIHSLPLYLSEDRRPYGNLNRCRSVMLVSALAPLVLVSFLWARQLYGQGAGLLAAALVGLEPNILAHARLITPDATLACWWLVSLALWWRYLERGGAGRLLLGALALGLALLTKYTSLLLLVAWPGLGLLLGRPRGRLAS